MFTVGDVSGSEVLTPQDHLYETHINELRTAVLARLPKSGGTMTGFLTLNDDPTDDLHPVTKRFFDDEIALLNQSLVDHTADIAALDARISAKGVLTMGSAAGSDHVTDGVNDGATLTAAIAALPAAGGKIFVRNGTYDWDATTDRVVLTKSNVAIEGETPGGVIFRATASLHPGGSDANGRYGILTIGKNQTTKQSNILIKNIIFDESNVTKTSSLTLDGGNMAPGQIGLQNVFLENVVIKNHGASTSDSVEAGLYIISGKTGSYGTNKGNVDNVHFTAVEVKDSNLHGMWILGGNVTNLTFDQKTSFHHCQKNGLNYFNYDGGTTSSDWIFIGTRFYNNMYFLSPSSQAHFRDSTQNGIHNLRIYQNYFGPSVNAYGAAEQEYALTPYWADNNEIVDCYFGENLSGISLGASLTGTYAKIFPLNVLKIRGNIFDKCRGTFDSDSAIVADISDNIFYRVKGANPVYGYSRHFPTKVHGNIFYDCHTDEAEPDMTNYRYAAIRVGGDGWDVQNNYIIDDRKLLDPSTAVSLSDVAGGVLGSRTYYVKYTFLSDTGETLGSAEYTRTVAANNLLKVTYGGFYSSGATRMNIYVGTSTGNQKLEGYIDLPNRVLEWTEPTTGLVGTGATVPVTNTTSHRTMFGIYQLSGGQGGTPADFYATNHFIGIETPIRLLGSYKTKTLNNFVDNTGYGSDMYVWEDNEYDNGNVAGSLTVALVLGMHNKYTLTGNITTLTLPDAAQYKGQSTWIIFVQDGTGSRTLAKPSNMKVNNGTFTLSTAPNAIDRILLKSDGTNWNEVGRSMALA